MALKSDYTPPWYNPKTPAPTHPPIKNSLADQIKNAVNTGLKTYTQLKQNKASTAKPKVGGAALGAMAGAPRKNVVVAPTGNRPTANSLKYNAPKAPPKDNTSSALKNMQSQMKQQQDKYAADLKAAQAKAKAEADAAKKKQNEEGKRKTEKQNESTKALADSEHGLLDSFGKQRDVKLDNIKTALASGDKLLLANYSNALQTFQGSASDNDKAEADASFRNVANAVRERGDILAEAASQGAGETDLARSQLMALRNYSANQSDVNRSFFDTLRSINNAVSNLNTDTSVGRTNMFNQAESDIESGWANYYNQVGDTWTQIDNIENANTNVDEDDSTGYKRSYADAAKKAAAATAGAYKKKTAPDDWTNWSGKGQQENRALSSTNRSATINLGGPVKRAEGATLRKW